MNSIGFNNFRKFTKFEPIKLGGITILVGGNNAGKSTLVKAMLLMRDFLKTRIEGTNESNIFKTLQPQFSFDTEHVNVGEFYRAFCRQSPIDEDTISFEMKIAHFFFNVKIRGERKPGIIPQVSMIVVSDEKRDATFTFDFIKNQMNAYFGIPKEARQSSVNDKKAIKETIDELKERLANSNDFEEIAELKLQIEKLEKEFAAQQQALKFTITSVAESATIDMSNFIGDNVGKLLIPELIMGFVHYAYVGTLGDKRSNEYKNQEGKKAFLRGKEEIIKSISSELESVLNNQVVEYIYSHSVAQTPCYSNAVSSNDYATRTIHAFYRSRISQGDEEFDILRNGLNLFNIGTSLKVLPMLGDSYRVVIFDKENPEINDKENKDYPGGIDLADKGMGSIQLVILLLRLVTLARKYKGQQLTILLEEPEQNLHPAVQSKLADVLESLNREYGFRFIVETHSEYMVRHIQVITAKIFKAGHDDTPFRVYYFTGDRSNPCDNMGFQKNGKFEKEFGPGFFNVADDAAMELFDLDEDNL